MNHLLTKHNILSDYKVTYQIPSDEIDKLRNQLSKKYKTKKTIDKKISEYIQSKFDNIANLQIPGLYTEEIEKKNETIKKINSSNAKLDSIKSENLFLNDFNKFSKQDQKIILESTKMIVKLLKSKNLSELKLFFIFQLIYNELKLDQSTFDKIINKYKNNKTNLNSNQIHDDDEDYEL